MNPQRWPVVLVGAGPGDPDQLTLAAVREIALADVILVDDLVDPRVLEHARAGARICRVGKRGGGRSTPQAFIDRLMVRESLAGHRVVRLKGGDPLVFGRAAEDIAALRAAGIEVRIVNGVSSALAAASALQMSLTHRDHGQGVVFVTGHPKDGGAAADWAALARSGFTLAIYMGLTRLPEIRAALLDAGLDPAMPAAAVQQAGGGDQRSLTSTVALLADDVRAAGLRSPVMVFIGRVVATATQFQSIKPDDARRPVSGTAGRSASAARASLC